MVNYITGDLFTTKADVIAHGVNCRGGFGSGVAGQIAKRYPYARHQYLSKFNKNGWKLGEVQLVNIFGEGLVIANCATQDNYGGSGLLANYEAIDKCLTYLEKYCLRLHLTLAIPRIGAGLANGDWVVIQGIIEKIFTDSPVKIEVYSL